MSDRKASDGKASDGKISGGKTGRPEKSRFGEQTDIRRGKGKEEKCKEHHSADKQDKWAGFFGALRIPQFPGSPKGCEDSGVEDPDVDQSEIPSEDPRICVKQHRHEPCPEQPSGEEGAPHGGKILSDPGGEEKAPDQDREEDQLHVLPCGFVDRGNQSHHRVLPGPFVEKMRQGTKNRAENQTCREIDFFIFHIFYIHKIPPHTVSAEKSV